MAGLDIPKGKSIEEVSKSDLRLKLANTGETKLETMPAGPLVGNKSN